jgi:hypothetical protein
MTIGFIFWLIMLLWLIFGLYGNRTKLAGGDYNFIAGGLLLFILLFLLGWRVFGFIIRDGN